MKKADYIKAHRKKWDWCYRHPSKEKCDWPEWEFNGGKYEEVDSDCFACEWAKLQSTWGRDCDNCLFVWPGEERTSTGIQTCVGITFPGVYIKWVNAKSLKTRKKYAAIIRDLKVRRKR